MIKNNFKHNDTHLYSFMTQRGRVVSLSQEDIKEIAKIYNNTKMKEYILEKYPNVTNERISNILDDINNDINEILSNSIEYTALEKRIIEKYIKSGENYG